MNAEKEAWGRGMRERLRLLNLNHKKEPQPLIQNDRGLEEIFTGNCHCCSVTKSCLTLRPHGLQHARLPCPLLSPWVCSNSCWLSRWCHPTILSSVTPFSSCPQSFQAAVSFVMELALCIRWPKYWGFSFSISPSNEYSGLISFRTDSFDLLAVQGTLKSFLRHHNSKASILQCSAFFMVQLTSIYDYFPRQFSKNKKKIRQNPQLWFITHLVK